MALIQNENFVTFCKGKKLGPMNQKLFALAVELGCGIDDLDVVLDSIDVDDKMNVTYVVEGTTGVEYYGEYEPAWFAHSIPLEEVFGSFKIHMWELLTRDEANDLC